MDDISFVVSFTSEWAHERYATAAPQLSYTFRKPTTFKGEPWWDYHDDRYMGISSQTVFNIFRSGEQKIWQSKATVSFQFSNHAKKK